MTEYGTRPKKSNVIFRVEYACKGAGVNTASKEDRILTIEDYEAFLKDGYSSKFIQSDAFYDFQFWLALRCDKRCVNVTAYTERPFNHPHSI